jgi:hypothetical protein
MHFYGLDYRGLLELPVVTFWELAKNTDRIRAEEDRRQMELIQNSILGDPKKYLEKLEKEQGKIFDTRTEKGFDRAGVDRLKTLMNKGVR